MICIKCNIEKGISLFHRDSRRRYGVTGICKECQRVERKAYYHKHRAEILAQQKQCSEEDRERRRKDSSRWYHNNRQRRADFLLMKLYGLTREQFDCILSNQGNRCAICRSGNPGKSWHVDHYHFGNPSGKGLVRGILCSRCNVGLGMFGDSVATTLRAAQYLLETISFESEELCGHSELTTTANEILDSVARLESYIQKTLREVGVIQ